MLDVQFHLPCLSWKLSIMQGLEDEGMMGTVNLQPAPGVVKPKAKLPASNLARDTILNTSSKAVIFSVFACLL